MHWIKKKRKPHTTIIPVKNSGASMLLKCTMKLLKGFILWVGAIVKILAIGAGVIGGALFGGYLTINYSDRFRSEEALRSFAFSNAYDTYKEKLEECNKVRHQAMSDAAVVYSTNILIEKYLENAILLMNQSFSGFALSEIKGVIEPYNKATNGLSTAWIGIRECERKVTNAGYDLATVLNISEQYQDLLITIDETKPDQVRVGGENIIINLLGDPALLAKLADAFENAQDGLGGRGASAFAKIRSLQKKSIPISKRTLDQYGKHVAFGLRAEKDTSHLFLTEFRKRFAEKPEISIRTVWRDITGAKTDINHLIETPELDSRELTK